MAISEVGTYQCLNPGSVTPQFQIPTSALPGDLCLVYLAGTAPDTCPAGWFLNGDDGTVLTQVIFGYWVTASDPGSVVTFGTTNYADGAMIVLRGAVPGTVSGGSSGQAGLTPYACTFESAGDWAIFFWWTRGSTVPDTCTVTAPGSVNADASYGGSTPSSGPPINAIAVAHQVATGAGGSLQPVATATYSSGSALSSGAMTVFIPAYGPPPAPVPLTPVSGAYVDAAANGVTLTWSPVPGQSYYQVLRTLGATTQAWDVSSGSWSSYNIWNASQNNSVAIPGSQWADGNQYTWTVAVQVGASPYSASGPSVAMVLNTETSDSVSVSAPTGTQTTTTPTVTFAGTFPAGLSLVQYRVIFYTSAQYGAGGFAPGVSAGYYDSGYLPTPGGSGPWNYVGPPITTGTGTFRAYVQIYDGHQYSAWAYSQFVENVTLPHTPTCVNTVNNATGSIGVQIANPSGGVTVDHNDIYRRVTSVGGNGERVATGLAVNALWTDYSPATGVDYEYQVLAVAASGVAGVGAWTD